MHSRERIGRLATIVTGKIAQAQVLRTTPPAEDWQQESVVEWTDWIAENNVNEDPPGP